MIQFQIQLFGPVVCYRNLFAVHKWILAKENWKTKFLLQFFSKKNRFWANFIAKKTIFNIQIMMMIVLMIFNDVIFAVIFFKVVKGEVWHNRGWSTKMKIIFQSFIFHTLDFDLMKKLEKDWLCVFGVWNIIIFFVNNQDIMIGFENIMDQNFLSFFNLSIGFSIVKIRIVCLTVCM